MLQRSDEWFAARAGKVTASRVADLMAKTKSGYSASRQNYMAQLICERLTGKPADCLPAQPCSAELKKNRSASDLHAGVWRNCRGMRTCSAPRHSRLRRIAGWFDRR